MHTRNPESPSGRPVTEAPGTLERSSPEMKESSIEYVGRSEPKIPLPVLFLGFAAAAAIIIAFLHFSRP